MNAPLQINRGIYHRNLGNLSNTDGREVLYTHGLRRYLSEGALHRYRGMVEIKVLIALSESDFPGKPDLTDYQKATLRAMTELNRFDATAAADYDHFGRNNELPLEHDVKAVEFYLRELFDQANLGHLKEWIHFPMTSEDCNNLAWNSMLRDAINNEWLPTALQVMDRLADCSKQGAYVPVIGTTHYKKASPVTMGKRFAYFLGLLGEVMTTLKDIRLTAKFGGSVGNHNAMVAVAPNFDIESFARDLVESFGFSYSHNTNQRNSHLTIVHVLNEVRLFNIVLADLCKNVLLNILLARLYQQAVQGTVGSSIMPWKINPWFFEVAQGLIEQSNALISAAAEGLIMSDFERDLSDHPWERGYGEMLGKSLAAMSYVRDGLDSLKIDEGNCLASVQDSLEVVTEAVQIAGRIVGAPNIYMKIKDLVRGKSLTRAALDNIIVEHIADVEMRDRLLKLKPEEYIGKATSIAIKAADDYMAIRATVVNGILDPIHSMDAVLFDFDGTLQVGDKDELHARLVEINRLLDLGFSENQIREFGNRSDYRQMRKLMVNAYNDTHSDSAITEEQFEQVGKQVSGMFDHLFALADDAKELLNHLKALGKKVGLVTTRGSNSLPRLLKTHDIAESFDVIVNRDDCQQAKPHPQPIALALEKLGVIDPTRAMYVGDKQEDDVTAGNALGMITVLVNSDPFDPYGAKPTHHFSSLKPLLRWFTR